MKQLFLAALLLPLFVGCYYGQRSATLQSADKCYLQFNGQTEGAKVVLDETTSFILDKSEAPEKFKPKKLYSIQPGKHRVQIFKNETMIIDQLIYIGNNETKEFIVP